MTVILKGNESKGCKSFFVQCDCECSMLKFFKNKNKNILNIFRYSLIEKDCYSSEIALDKKQLIDFIIKLKKLQSGIEYEIIQECFAKGFLKCTYNGMAPFTISYYNNIKYINKYKKKKSSWDVIISSKNIEAFIANLEEFVIKHREK